MTHSMSARQKRKTKKDVESVDAGNGSGMTSVGRCWSFARTGHVRSRKGAVFTVVCRLAGEE
jgi:hypothetical protein